MNLEELQESHAELIRVLRMAYFEIRLSGQEARMLRNVIKATITKAEKLK